MNQEFHKRAHLQQTFDLYKKETCEKCIVMFYSSCWLILKRLSIVGDLWEDNNKFVMPVKCKEFNFANSKRGYHG
jgi:hypothetical protein